MNSFPYFIPDPSIPDSDVLGIGELMFDDGTSQFVDDPEIASGYQMQAPQQVGLPDLEAITPTPEAIEMIGQPLPPLQGADGQMYELQPDGTFAPASNGGKGTADPMTGELLPELDPAGSFDIGEAATGAVQGIGQALEIPPMAQYGQQPAGTGGEQGLPDLNPITPTPQAIQSIGQPPPPVQGADGRQYSVQPDGTFVPYERQGALPPDVAQRQLGQMGQQIGSQVQATQQARADEARLMNELTLQQMAQIEGQRYQQQQEIYEQQQKVERWRGEQQALLDMEIETDLVSARGPIGAAMAVLGATLLGAAGNDVGLRMIDKTIDTHVRNQVHRRDTKLGILAEQIGSSEQAIKMGKGLLMQNAAQRLELLAQKTKNDIFEAQTPAVIETLKQKGLQYLQEAEKESLGKLIERAPLPPKPPSQEMLMKYGELRRERAGNDTMIQRMEQQTGLQWAPGQNGQPGHYVNAADVIKNGIEGTGAIEQWIPDSVYSTMGLKDGYQVRGAKQALAYAVVRQMQPTGPITDVDRKVGEVAATLDTEEGLVSALTRLRAGDEEQRALDVQQYGADVVGEFERRGGGQQQLVRPPLSRPASLAEKRSGAQALRQGAPPQEQGAVLPTPEARMQQVTEDIMALTADELGPEGMDILIAQAAHESGNGDSAGAKHNNFFGHKQSGSRPGFEANTTEGFGKTRERVKQTFASYDTSASAVADHVSLLKRRYPRAWEALVQGDPDAYVAGLQQGAEGWPGYFTGNPDAYLQRILERLP